MCKQAAREAKLNTILQLLGPQVLDEPAAVQSDAGVLALQLRALGRAAPGAALDAAGRLEAGGNQGARAKGINAWIASVAGERRGTLHHLSATLPRAVGKQLRRELVGLCP